MEWIISIGYLAAFVAALLGIALALIFLHELGHLSAAWLVGWTPFVFRVGGGRLLLGWRCGELSLQVGRNVFFGYVRAAANSPQLFRTKQIVFATGGVIADQPRPPVVGLGRSSSGHALSRNSSAFAPIGLVFQPRSADWRALAAHHPDRRPGRSLLTVE